MTRTSGWRLLKVPWYRVTKLRHIMTARDQMRVSVIKILKHQISCVQKWSVVFLCPVHWLRYALTWLHLSSLLPCDIWTSWDDPWPSPCGAQCSQLLKPSQNHEGSSRKLWPLHWQERERGAILGSKGVKIPGNSSNYIWQFWHYHISMQLHHHSHVQNNFRNGTILRGLTCVTHSEISLPPAHKTAIKL